MQTKLQKPAKDGLSLASSLLPENGDLSSSKVIKIKILLILKVFYLQLFTWKTEIWSPRRDLVTWQVPKKEPPRWKRLPRFRFSRRPPVFGIFVEIKVLSPKSSTEFCLPWPSTMGSGKGGGAGKGEKHWLPSNPSLLCRSGHLNQIALSSHLQTQVLVSRPHPTKWQVPTWSLSAGWKGSCDIVPASSYMSSANGLADPQK